MKKLPAIALPVLALAVFSLPGCHDPRYHEAQAVRNERMRSLFARIEPRREKGTESIHAVSDLHLKLEAHRRENLQGTFDFVETREANRKDVWQARTKQQHWHGLFFGGHPERIDDTYSKMFY